MRRQNGGRTDNGVRRALGEMGRTHREITALYLFGSGATGRAGPLSDLDVAVLLDEKKVSPSRRFRLRLDLIGEAMRAGRRSDVDLVFLNEAAPLLTFEVVRAGQVLYERDRDARIAFEARTAQRYLDIEPFYRVSGSYLKRQILGPKRRG